LGPKKEAVFQTAAIHRLAWHALAQMAGSLIPPDELADGAAQAIVIGERLLADRECILGHGCPDTLQSRSTLAIVCQAAGRTGEALTLHEHILAARERVLGVARR